jgi:hypothetical protein
MGRYWNGAVPTQARPLGSGSGGTGQGSYTAGDILIAKADGKLYKRAIGTSGQVLTVDTTDPQKTKWAAPSNTSGAFGGGWDYLVPVMTGPTTNGVTIGETGYLADGGADTYRAWRAFTRATSDNPAAYFHSPVNANLSSNFYITINLAAQAILKGLTWRGYAVDPKTYSLDGSNDGTNWTTIISDDQYANVAWPSGYEKARPLNIQAFSRYRFKVTRAWDGNDQERDYFQLLNLNLIGYYPS